MLSGRVVLCRADHSSRGFLPSVVCLNVIVNLDSEEAIAQCLPANGKPIVQR